MTWLGAAVFSHAAAAGSLEVNPIRVELSQAVRSAPLSVRNSGSEATVIQVSVQSWSQEGGVDSFGATNEVLVSPPIATIPPGQEQIIRVGLRRAPDEQRELSYRVFVQEVPPPPKPGFQGLQVALRISLPIFVQPRQGPAKPQLAWDAQMRDNGTVQLTLKNNGAGHIQLAEVEMSLPGEQEPVISQNVAAYVLAGQTRQWEMKPRHSRLKKTDRLQLKASTDAGSISYDIELAGS